MPFASSVAAAIEAGETVIASSARAARALRRLHGEAQRGLGLAAWKSADILDWDSWLNRLWQNKLRSGSETRLLLSAVQEQQVWVRQVEPDIRGKRLISVLGVSELAQQAYGLLCAYGALDFLSGERWVGQDVASFRSWARDFEHTCSREGWLSRSRLPAVLVDAVARRQVEAVGRLVLTGFDRLTPAQQSLVEALRESGHAVEIAAPAEVAEEIPPLLVEAMDGRDEIHTCALWLRHALAKNGRHLAIVVPGVAARRPEIERIFRQVLAPETVTITERDGPLPFEFSLGIPLAQVPMTRAALLLLRWMEKGILQDQASWLLLSGFVSTGPEELLLLARFDAKLRQSPMRPPELEIESLLHSLDRGWQEARDLGELRKRLRTARRVHGQNVSLSFPEWVRIAGEILEAVHWPGAREQESEDFQVRARWSQLLDAVAGLAFEGAKVRYVEFLDVLEQQAGQTIFAPESREAPIQILGPLEAAGLTFDALWFLGADDASWPAVARPHPFLSRSLQREHAMPHATSDLDWNLAQQVTHRLQKSAARCVFSYAAHTVEGECRPSTLLNRDTGVVKTAELRSTVGAHENPAAEHDEPEDGTEQEPSAILPWPVEKDAGGAEVLKDQAACPFRSFAKQRLGARPMEESDWGLDPRERGSLMHTILENLWAELKNRGSLVQAAAEGRLTEIASRHVDAALERYRVGGPKNHWNQAYLAAEGERVLSLVEEWLDYEATRTDFSVEAREEKRTAMVGDLRLQLRVDRIDTLQDGRIIIDYKTGAVKTDIWDGVRPDDPQLPIYAGYGQVEGLTGVLLGRVADAKIKFIGRVEDGTVIVRGDRRGDTDLTKPPYSQEMLHQWRGVLIDLADQFVRGEAQVDPKQYPKTCKFCALPGLCRVAESGHAQAEDAADAGDGEIG